MDLSSRIDRKRQIIKINGSEIGYTIKKTLLNNSSIRFVVNGGSNNTRASDTIPVKDGVLQKIANVLKVDLQVLFNFNHFKSLKEMREDIMTNLNLMSDDDIRFIHKFIDQKYVQHSIF